MIRPGEVYHGPAFIIPGGRQPFARVSTVHDLFTHTHPQFYPFKFRLWLRWMTEVALKRADRIIVPAETVRAEILRRRLAPSEKIAVIPEAPDETDPVWDAAARDREDALRRLTADRDRPILLTVGTLDPRKDPHTAQAGLLELEKILGAQPDLPMPLRRGVAWIWIGGPGPVPDDTPPDVQRKAKLLGFQAVGHAPGAAVQPALKASAIYVTCSRTEGFGIPVVEAMAAGCPIVATDIPIHREVAGDAALYFPEGDARALGETLFKLLSDGALRATLGANGLRRAASFSWRRAAELTLQVYREAAEAAPMR
jgi:glycosyltransferase involved in cell wall biosynthesis